MSDLIAFALGAASALGPAAILCLRARRRAARAMEGRDAELARLREQGRADLAAIEALRAAASAPDPRIEAENAELRRRMDELADALMAEPRGAGPSGRVARPPGPR